MTDETTAAIQALIKQVGALTTQLDEQNARLDNLHEFNGRVLDQKKDLERKQPTAEKIAEMASNGMELGADGNWYLKGSQPKHSLTREEARDPARYREAKAAAEKAGATLTIVDPETQDQTRRNSRGEVDTSTKTTVIKDDDQQIAYMRRDAMREDPRQYRQLRAAGLTVQPWDTATDLPQHMQTKFALMEKSHDA